MTISQRQTGFGRVLLDVPREFLPIPMLHTQVSRTGGYLHCTGMMRWCRKKQGRKDGFPAMDREAKMPFPFDKAGLVSTMPLVMDKKPQNLVKTIRRQCPSCLELPRPWTWIPASRPRIQAGTAQGPAHGERREHIESQSATVAGLCEPVTLNPVILATGRCRIQAEYFAAYSLPLMRNGCMIKAQQDI